MSRLDDCFAIGPAGFRLHAVASPGILAVRPDRYIGLRDDRGDARAADACFSRVVAG
ncbi:MAG: hypothetical protein U0R70_12240 [Solirubrobacteraceae bacterium]